MKDTQHLKGNICCEGCLKIGIKQGKKETFEDELTFLETIKKTYDIKNIFFKQDLDERITEIKKRINEL